MIKLFSRNKEKSIVNKPVDDTKTMQKSITETIEEIHESFYTEVDKLLAEAKISRSLDSDKQDLIDKRNRLIALGFTATKEVQEAQQEVLRLDRLKTENERKKELLDAINYFSFKYPMYKFITEDSVKKICNKYNLVYGEISKYIGTVPDKNLKNIEQFKIADEDACYIKTTMYNREYFGIQKVKKIIDYKQYMDSKNNPSFSNVDFGVCPLEIAAPLKDFNMKDSEVRDFEISKIEIPDPIVLKPVYHLGKKHYLIVDAWGIEASDENVLNPIHN